LWRGPIVLNWNISIGIVFISVRLMWHVRGAVPVVTTYANDFIVMHRMPVLVDVDWLWTPRFIITI
jgi:hypothetical protein